MNIYTSEQVFPYVYMCIHQETKHFYIGSRTARNITYSHLDLPKYRTSSPKVNPNFDQYDWIIVAEFFNADDAYDFEQELIYNTWDDPLSLNESCYYGKHRFRLSGPRTQEHKDAIGRAHKGKTIYPESIAKAVATRAANGGWAISEETRAKLVKASTGRKHTKDAKKKVSLARTGKKLSEHTKQKLSAMNKGKRTGEDCYNFGTVWITNGIETIRINKKEFDKYSEKGYIRGGRKQKTVTCPHCGTVGGAGTMPRWHFDKCQSR